MKNQLEFEPNMMVPVEAAVTRQSKPSHTAKRLFAPSEPVVISSVMSPSSLKSQLRKEVNIGSNNNSSVRLSLQKTFKGGQTNYPSLNRAAVANSKQAYGSRGLSGIGIKPMQFS